MCLTWSFAGRQDIRRGIERVNLAQGWVVENRSLKREEGKYCRWKGLARERGKGVGEMGEWGRGINCEGNAKKPYG